MLPYIVAGLTTGSIFALAAVGLVLTYKTSGVVNFAHGAQASASAFLFYFLRTENGMNWPLAAAICIFVGGPALGLILEWIVSRLTHATLPSRILATVGILLVIQGAIQLLYPPGPDRYVHQYLPTGTVDIGGTPVEYFRIIIFGISIAFVVGLTLFLRRSRTGLAMRAVVDNAELVDVMGTSPTRTRRTAWLIGSSTAAASGVLLAPLLPLDATTLTFLVITAFGAAAVGAFTNLPLTYLGGLAIGIAQALCQKWFVAGTGLMAGLAASLPFLVLFVLLLVAPRLRRPSAVGAPRRSGSPWRAPWTVRGPGLIVLAVVLLLAPSWAGSHIIDWTRLLAYTILFISLGLLVKMSGQVSLGHVTFMTIGVAGFVHLGVEKNLPWGVSLIIAALVAAPVGALLAIPAIRFPGFYLAIATLGFGILVQQMFYNTTYMFGDLGQGLTIPRPTSLAGIDLTSDQNYYYVVLAVLAICAVLVGVVDRSRLGRLLRAMSDSPAGLSASGASINVTRVLVFSVSASLAAVAGVLDAGTFGVVFSDGYQPVLSLQLFALVMLSAGNLPWYAVGAAAGQVLIPAYISSDATVNYALTLIFGVFATLFAITPDASRELPSRVRKALDRLAARRRTQRGEKVVPDDAAAVRRRRADAPTGLAAREITVRFGGHVAVDEVSLQAPVGKIVGLIGPNGAGKTTMFNACFGLVRPTTGEVALDGRQLGRMGTARRARRGIGRTFQQVELFDTLTTRENVSLGWESGYANWNPLRHIVSTRSERGVARSRASEALELCGIVDLADRPVGTLSTGQRRLVELARCVAGPFHVLLLDEPSSGLDPVETERFGGILTRIVAERDVAILLVEHDMSLVNRLCDHVYVIDFGKPIFEGTVSEIAESPLVRAAYLGSSREFDEAAREDRHAATVDAGGSSVGVTNIDTGSRS